MGNPKLFMLIDPRRDEGEQSKAGQQAVPPNTACTRLVGVCAFSSSLRGLKWVLANGVISSRPPAGNASRWATLIEVSNEGTPLHNCTPCPHASSDPFMISWLGAACASSFFCFALARYATAAQMRLSFHRLVSMRRRCVMKVSPYSLANHLICLPSTCLDRSRFLLVKSFVLCHVEFWFHQVSRCSSLVSAKVL